jgi:two-component system chemotaxis response regulator CheY
VEGIERGMMAADDIIALDGTTIVRKGIELEGRHMRLFKRALISQVRVLPAERPAEDKDTIHIDEYPNNLACLKAARIMIVDDSKFLRFKLHKALTSAGLTVVGQAEDGNQAVDKAKELQPTMVTMDIEMPNFDGLSAVEPVRAAAPGAEVVMISSAGDEERVLIALARGAMDFIHKPIDPVSTVRAIINMIIVSKEF